MTTYITVVTGPPGVVEQAKDVQGANRDSQLQKERDRRTAQQLEAQRLNQQQAAEDSGLIAPVGGNPDTSLDPRPAAQRQGGAVLGVQWGITAPATGNPQLQIGPPGWGSSVTVTLDKLNYTLPPGYGLPVSGTGYVQRGYEISEMFLLPHTSKGCVAVYLQNKIFRFQTFTYSTTYDPAVAGGDDLFEIRAFYVSRESVREITVPTALDANLREMFPPLQPNTTVSYQGGPFFVIGGAPAVTVPDMFSDTLWAATTRYGDYYLDPFRRDYDMLARQFGMGVVQGYTLLRRQYSPAVYQFLLGPMTMVVANRNYAYMRDAYYPQAPRYYLADCVLGDTCTSERVGFDVTTEEPVDIYSGGALDLTRFKRKKSYDVPLNGADRTTYNYNLSYAWNWDNPSYCRQRLTALGFTAADLTP